MNRQQRLEMALLFSLGVANVFQEWVGYPKILVVAAGVIGWAVAALLGSRSTPHYWRERGFRPPQGSLWPLWATTLAATAGMGVGGVALGHLPPPPSWLWVLLAYLPWALVQQFFLCGVLLPQLCQRWPTPGAVLLAGGLFAAAHLPDLPLVGLAFPAGLLWSYFYLRIQSLYPLALAHAWLGTLTYYLLLGRDVGGELLRFFL